VAGPPKTYWHCLPTGAEEAVGNPRVSAETLRQFAFTLLVVAGLTEDDARDTAACLVHADLRAVGTHGVFRLMQYVDSIDAGEINLRPNVRIIREGGAACLVDADGGYGYRPTLMAIDKAVALAREQGIGCVGVRNSHHFGMAAAFVLRAADAGAIGFVTTNSLSILAPTGGSRGVVGNNPYAFAIPRGGGRRPIVVDIALTDAKFGAVPLAAAEGRRLGPGLALDAAGHPTLDAQEALRSGLLTTIGGPKGYGLAVVAEILAGALTGSPLGRDSHSHRHQSGGVGHLVLAIQPEIFISREAFDEAVEKLCTQIDNTPPADPGVGVYVPGELGWQTFDRRQRNGIPLPKALYDELNRLAQRFDLGPLTVVE
jgi:LDH2 family malate/lactate/ureidoglycolate dehydrogenase